MPTDGSSGDRLDGHAGVMHAASDVFDPGRLQHADRLFHELLDTPAPQRVALLAERCAGDDRLRGIVQQMLEADSSGMSGFLSHPILESPPEPLAAPPTRLGRYTIVREIGRGGMGVVYEARQQRPQRSVALKMLRTPFPSQESLHRFRYEAEVLGLLQHPGIAQVYEADVADVSGVAGVQQVPYFVMELVRGEPLTAYARVRNLDARQRLELFAGICDVVQHAHQRGVIHRDLKPANILVTDAGTEARSHGGTKGAEAPARSSLRDSVPSSLLAFPKILDFGVARAAGPDVETLSLQTAAGQLIGTLPYMSPEQVAGDPRQIDTRSDVYALGAVLYELLADRLPFDLKDRTLPEAARAITSEEPPRLSTLNRRFGGDVEAICAQALAKEKERRYQSAADLARDIRHHLAGEPIEAKRGSGWYVLRKTLRRYWVPTSVAAAFVLLIVASAVTSTIGWRRAAHAESEQRLARQEADAQRKLAKQRADETQKVADFQSDMLNEIDVEAMGRGIKQRFREQVRAALARQYVGEDPDRRRRTPEEVEAELAAYDERADAALPADVARRVMDEFVLARAGEALEGEFGDQPLVQAQVQNAIGKTYQALALYDVAEPHLRSALELRRRELDGEHELIATSLNELAELLRDKGDYAAAEPLYIQSLDMYRNLLGEEHAYVATSLNNLALLLQAKGNYPAAEPLYRQALDMRRKLFGEEHTDVATSLNSLASLLRAKGDFAAAEPLYRQALEVYRSRLGGEHPRVAGGLNNLAELLKARGDYDAAEPLYRQALDLYRKRLGDEHHDTVATLNNLAELLKLKGDYDAAEPLYRQALDMSRKLLGDQHPDVAKGLNNLAALHWTRRDFAAAEPLFRQALDTLRRLLGDEHPDVATALNNLAGLYWSTGDFAAAEPLLRQSLAIGRRLQSEEHPDVVGTLYNLAEVIKAKGDERAAEPLFREALDLCRRVLGDDHPNTQHPAMSLASTLIQLSRFSEAEVLLLAVAERCERSEAIRRLHQPRDLRLLVKLYDAWHAAEPTAGHDAQAAQWRSKLADWQATTRPAAAAPPAVGQPKRGDGGPERSP